MSVSPASPRLVACPQCGTLRPWGPDNPYRPFCSERCKLLDLGAWATESYRVAQVEQDEGDGQETGTGLGAAGLGTAGLGTDFSG